MPRLRSVKTLMVLAVGLAVLGGCANKAVTSTSPESTHVIDIEDYKALRDAHMQLGKFTAEMNREISANESLPVRAERVSEVLKKYERRFPKPNPTAYLSSGKQAPKGSSLTAELTRLASQTVEYTDKERHEASDPCAASYVAQQYLSALHYLYGLDEFEQYLTQHTTSEGTMVNPKDPPEQMDGGMKIFGMHGLHEGVFINISSDATTGRVTYKLGGRFDPLSDATIPDLEREFITGASESVQIGDGYLIDWFMG